MSHQYKYNKFKDIAFHFMKAFAALMLLVVLALPASGPSTGSGKPSPTIAKTSL